MPAPPESRRAALSVRERATAQSPDLVFFSSVSETRRFVERFDRQPSVFRCGRAGRADPGRTALCARCPHVWRRGKLRGPSR